MGPVLEVDIDSIALEYVRCKLGVRNVNKVPAYTEITTKELLVFRITFDVEVIVEQGWYNSAGKTQDMGQEERLEEGGEDNIHRAAKRGRGDMREKKSYQYEQFLLYTCPDQR